MNKNIVSIEEFYNEIVVNKKFPQQIAQKMNSSDRMLILGSLYFLNDISSDERLLAVLQCLETIGISKESLAALTDTRIDEIKLVKRNPERVNFEEKYYFSSKIWMIYFLLKEIIQADIN